MSGRTFSEMPELVVERRLDAVSERVFELWTNGDAWARWFLPPGDAEWIQTPTVDPRPGGRIAIAVRQHDGKPALEHDRHHQEHCRCGAYRE